MWKDRTNRWGFGKTVKKGGYDAIIRRMEKRSNLQEGEQRAGFWISGREVKRRDVERYLKRRKIEDPGRVGENERPGPDESQMTRDDSRDRNPV
jgi:hypothetical protein